MSSVAKILKRIIDFIAALLVLIILSPLLLIVALFVRFKLGRSILFCQQRPGLNAKPFTIYKFRTMIAKTRDEKGNILPDDKRLTSFGLWLRSTSLDELPELFNVLEGDMSLVGPRPLMTKYLARYTQQQGRRHEVKPGITGWAQINGRNNITWEEKFDLDVWYVDNWSLWLDIKILLRTFRQVINRKGVAKEGHVTVDEFMGSKNG
jgi:lipopolysaccharide/colanic/teichoic acid biosynthesis glycosyltransferase